MSDLADLEFHPLTPERWPDLERLFGPNGAYGGCWCMWWRLKRSDFAKGGEQNKRAMQAIVQFGEVPGIIAYVGDEPAGWCSVARREQFGSLERSRNLKRVDDQPVWSIVCFFVGRRYRGQGLMERLLRAAVDYAADQGATIVEAYPYEAEGKLPVGTKAYMGVAAVFREAEFVEVARPSQAQRIMRYHVKGGGT